MPHHDLSSYAGKWALVTGGCSGIGRAYAKALLGFGIHTVIVSNHRERLERTRSELAGISDARIEILCADLSGTDYADSVRRLVGEKDFCVFVSNASYGMGGAFDKQDLASLENMVRVNTHPYLTLSHIFVNDFLKKGSGAIVFVASLNVASPVPGAAVYTATKAFEYYLGCALARELDRTPVTVQVVLPGPTRTNFQAVAGTKIARTAIAPEELVRGSVRALGGSVLFIPKFRNRIVYALSRFFTLKKRIRMAENYYRKLLHETPGIGMTRLFFDSFLSRKNR